MNVTWSAFHTLSTGMPAIGESGSSSAALFTVSFAPKINKKAP